MMRRTRTISSEGEIKVSFGYHCNSYNDGSCTIGNEYNSVFGTKIPNKIPKNRSFSCLSGAAISANATLANTNICNGVIGEEILPSWDSPKSFRRVPSSPNLSRLDILSPTLQSSLSNLSCSPSTPSPPEYDCYLLSKPKSSPSRSEGFLNALEVQVAGGAAGEDRIQAVCSEDNGWVFCGIYDGFNGRDAADFLAGTLYDTIILHTNLLEWEPNQDVFRDCNGHCVNPFQQYSPANDARNTTLQSSSMISYNTDSSIDIYMSDDHNMKLEVAFDSFRNGVIDSLQHALNQAENDFLYMVEQEMEDRPDLVSVGSCVLIGLLHGMDLYTLSLGDSRAVLGTYDVGDDVKGSGRLKAVQLTDCHSVDNEQERARLLADHPDDPATVVGGKVKGKLNVTRAFGVGYLKKKKLNDALMGILQVRNLMSPPYISIEPSVNVHRISNLDHFVVFGSDGLFDFFSNDEVVNLVNSYISSNPSGDPAKYLLEQLIERAADCAGFSLEELMNIPAGQRRKYHDDVTVIVIVLGNNQRTTKASTYM